MKYYIPAKPKKLGFKLHLLAESSTIYCYKLMLDYKSLLLKEEDNDKLSENIVLTLVETLKDQGYILYLDSWLGIIRLI